jgi:hypothetical protein
MILIVVNAVISGVVGAFLLLCGLLFANGKKPIRIFGGLILLYFCLMYIFVLDGLLTETLLGPVFLRPALPLLYLLPFMDAWADGFHRKHEA